MRIKLTSPFVFKGAEYTHVVIDVLLFVDFVNLVKSAQAKISPAFRYDSALQRERIAHQVKLSNEKGNTSIEYDDVTNIPITVAKQFLPLLSQDEGKPGSPGQGDGLSSPIIYKLGTPIKLKEDLFVHELEFFASTYGDIEDVLSGDVNLFQTHDLIEKTAKPLGTDLTALPSWAMKQITLADGVTIMNKVLPSFLD